MSVTLDTHGVPDSGIIIIIEQVFRLTFLEGVLTKDLRVYVHDPLCAKK